MDNINISSLSSSTPHKPHYIPEFYHHHHYNHQIPPQEHPSPMSSTYNPSLTFNLIQDENDIDDPDQNDERQQPLPPQQNLNDDDDDKEPMFEKPLTPSDVGKLNRLVIPKQHAEKYFPLGGGGGGGGESGLLLSFEDELGKFWRFRYSYWNSSQSYVLTKGWSRYVKEKRLDAGDVVLFERHRRDGDRLFIGWRRRAPSAQDSGAGPLAVQVSGGTNRAFYSAPHPYPAHHHHHHHHHHQPHYQHHHHPAAPYQPDCIHSGSSPAENNFQTTTIGNNNSNNSKIVRLFGVNLECQLADHESEPSTPDGSSLSSHGPPPQPPGHHNFYPPHAYYSDHHMDFTISRDVKAVRNRRG